MEEYLENFSENLKRLRIIYNISQRQLAIKSGVPRSNLSYYESKKAEPTLTQLIKISNFFYISIDDLIFKKLDLDYLKNTRINKESNGGVKSSSFEIFQNNLRILRGEKKLYRVELAEKTDMSVSNISFYESGKIEPKLSSLVKISEFFGVSIDELVSENISQEINIERFYNEEKNYLEKIERDIDKVEKDELLEDLYKLRRQYEKQHLRMCKLIEIDIPTKIKKINHIIQLVESKNI